MNIEIQKSLGGKIQSQSRIIRAEMYDAGFCAGHSNFECLSRSSDGKLYYMICSHIIDVHAQMYQFDPVLKKIKHLSDIGEVVGENSKKAVPQGKGHVNFYEHKGKLYSATHVGFYKPRSGEDDFIELVGSVEGHAPYPGGHFISYDLTTGEFEDLAKAPVEEGIVTMIMDKERERLYGLSWPGGLFLYYDLPSKTFKNLGPVFEKGEAGDFGKGEWKLICRNFALDPRDGNLYWSRAKGEILKYEYGTDSITMLEGCDLKDEAFGELTDHSLWRSIVWYDKEEVFYGIHYKSSYLFRFDPRKKRVKPLKRIAAEPYNDPSNHKEASYLPFRTYHWYWSTLAFKLGPDGETLYYLASGPPPDQQEGWKVWATTRFITYHIPSGTYRDHGTLRLADGRYPTDPQSLEVCDGMVCSVQMIEVPEHDHSEKAKKIRDAWVKRDKPYPEETNLTTFRDPLL